MRYSTARSSGYFRGSLVALTIAIAVPALAQQHPPGAPPSASTPASVHLGLADGAIKRRDSAMAERELKAALAAAPGDPAVALAVGTAYYGLSRVDDAIRVWNQGLTAARTPDLLFNLGIAYRGKGLFAQSIASFEEVLTVAPPTEDALFQLADTYARAKDTAKALDTYARLTTLFPNSAAAWNNLGNLRASLGRFDEAIVAYREGARLAPNDADIVFNLGRALQDSHDNAGAAS